MAGKLDTLNERLKKLEADKKDTKNEIRRVKRNQEAVCKELFGLSVAEATKRIKFYEEYQKKMAEKKKIEAQSQSYQKPATPGFLSYKNNNNQ